MKQLVTILILFCFACNKQVQQEKRYGGVIADDEKAVAKVPLIVSKGFVSVSANNAHTVIARGKQDKSVPKIAFINPIDQAQIAGLTNIQVSVSDNVGVSSVVIKIDGLIVYVRNGFLINSVSYDWDIVNETTGLHIITAIANDGAGNTRTVSITVFIETTIVEPPTETGVSLTMPPVIHQGSEGSCVAMAVGYAARSTESRSIEL